MNRLLQYLTSESPVSEYLVEDDDLWMNLDGAEFMVVLSTGEGEPLPMDDGDLAAISDLTIN